MAAQPNDAHGKGTKHVLNFILVLFAFFIVKEMGVVYEAVTEYGKGFRDFLPLICVMAVLLLIACVLNKRLKKAKVKLTTK